MSEEFDLGSINESDLLLRLQRWCDRQPTRVEIEDFVSDITFNQIIDTVNRLLGYIHSSK